MKRILAFTTLLAFVLVSELSASEAANTQLAENLVQLDGSASSDDDGDNLRYFWRQVAGPRVKLINSTTARPSFYAAVPGRYTFELVVSDGKAKSEPALVNVEVERLNRAPVAAMNRSISGKINENILLDASASSDADGDALTYQWYQISGPKLMFRAKETETPFLNLSFQEEGDYSFELVTSDGTVKSKPVRCNVKIIKPNAAPVARVVRSTQRVMIRKNNAPAQTYNYNDNNNSSTVIENYSAPKQEQAKPYARAVSSASAATAPLSAPAQPAVQTNPKSEQASTITFEEFAASSVAQNPQATCKVGNNSCNIPQAKPRSMNPVSNPEPVITTPIASTSGNNTVEPNSKVTIKGFGIDPLNRTLKYQWKQTAGPRVQTSATTVENLQFIPKQEGIYIFELTVNNGREQSKPAACAITVARDVNGLMSLGGGDKIQPEVNDVEIPGIDPVAVPTRRGGLLSRFFSNENNAKQK